MKSLFAKRTKIKFKSYSNLKPLKIKCPTPQKDQKNVMVGSCICELCDNNIKTMLNNNKSYVICSAKRRTR